MKKVLGITAMILAFTACTKQEAKDDGVICLAPPSELSGNWKIIEMRADPGDGSGKFIPTSENISISFKDGVYTDSRSADFNRYRFTATDTVELYNNITPQTKKLALQQLTASTLTYYCNWPWCGGPYGEKFIKQ